MKQQSLKARRYRDNMFELINFDAIPPVEQWELDTPSRINSTWFAELGTFQTKASGFGSRITQFGNTTTDTLAVKM